jgi:hypothetical protein
MDEATKKRGTCGSRRAEKKDKDRIDKNIRTTRTA